MPIKFSNNANTTLASGITAAATSLSVAAGTGAKFPALAAGDYFYATLVSAANPSNFEIVKVTARSTDTFTITRAQESTTALAFVAGDTVQLRFTAQTFQDALNERIQQGGGTGQGSNKIYIGWLGSQLGLQVDVTDFGGSWPINISGSASQLVTTNGYQIASLLTGNNTDGWGRFINSGGALYFQAGSLNSGSATAQPFVWTNMYGGSERMRLDASGNLTASGNVTAYSDERLKINWRPVTYCFVERLAEVKSGVFERTDTGETQVGVGAQSLQKVLPEAITENIGVAGGDVLSVNYGAAAMVAAVELAKEVVALRKEIEALKRAR